MTDQNKILDEAKRLRRRRTAMITGYNITGGIIGIIGFAGIWYYCGWQASLFIIVLMWGNNISIKANEL